MTLDLEIDDQIGNFVCIAGLRYVTNMAFERSDSLIQFDFLAVTYPRIV
jgi:hypothetical protein